MVCAHSVARMKRCTTTVAARVANIDDKSSPLPDEGNARGRVLDPVRRRWVTLTPEEAVRQRIIATLHEGYGYPLELMQVEGTISVNGLTRRCDIVVYDTAGRPHIIVECKRPDVAITQRVCDQACRYNTALHVPLLVLTNGVQQVVVEVDFDRRVLRQLDDLPKYST